ncbi:MAG: putative quorum-sensing-regulated virulence factor [Verrucomicrobiota bacterium]
MTLAADDNDTAAADEKWRRELEQMLREIAPARMPFGKFGPKNCPPNGRYIVDLPYEYLRYFARQGFPRGRLGELLRIVYQLKCDGADDALKALRQMRPTP